MQDTQEMVTLQTEDLLITAGSELVGTRGGEFVWGYYFCIENTSDEKITLIGKDWNITDAAGNSFSDTTSGFKGEVPEIEPGEYFEFTSEAPLMSSNGVFYGSCRILKNGTPNAQNIKLPVLQFKAGDKYTIACN